MKIVKISSLITALISAMVCLFNIGNIGDAYTGIIIYPYLFFLFAIVLFTQMKRTTRIGKKTVGIVLGLQWLRMVFLPCVGCLSGHYSSTENLPEKTVILAVILTIYEAIALFLVCLLVLSKGKKSIRSNPEKQFLLKGDVRLYIVFIVFALGLMFYTGSNPYSFLRFDVDDTRVALTNEAGSVIEAIISNGLTFLVISILYYMKCRYETTGQKRYTYFALICVLLRLCLISSESRLAVVYLLGTFLLILPLIFPRQKKMIVMGIIITSSIIIGFLTIYKVFYAFLYSSYSEAISARADSFDLDLIASQIDVYFYGTRTVARGLHYVITDPPAFYTPILDLLRNTFGIHYLIGKSVITTTEGYNLFMYSGLARSGHLFASTAWGYAYLTGLLAPIATIINLLIAYWFEVKLENIRYMDVYYFMSIGFIRFAVTVFAGFGPSWNIISRTLIIGFTVIGVASITRRHIHSGTV